MRRDLKDKVIIITGASSGIGAATALACAEAGMHTVLNARRAEKLNEIASQVRERGRDAEIVVGGVTEPELSNQLLDAAKRRFGRFDAVFANAGYGFHLPMTSTSDSTLREIFEVNFFAGVDLLQKAAATLIAEKRSGHLLMCSSCLAKFSMSHHGAYCATKAAQNHICRAMNIELRQHGIHVSSVHPIGTRTEFFEASARHSGESGVTQAVVSNTPGIFMQPPQRVANAIVKCLRRPRSEVWTSPFVRYSAGVMTAWPWVADFMMNMTDRRLVNGR
jgi:NAD(P)-dependent dehydrogenase (short-subunit alcohol dehydrogenase family)